MTTAGTKATKQTYYPSLDEAKRLAESANLVPVYVEINADLETPVSAYLKVARPPFSFLLESVEGGEQLARYSFIGTEPTRIIKTGPGQPEGEVDPLITVEQILSEFTIADTGQAVRFNGGMVGYLSYEVGQLLRAPALPGEGHPGLAGVHLHADDHVRGLRPRAAQAESGKPRTRGRGRGGRLPGGRGPHRRAGGPPTRAAESASPRAEHLPGCHTQHGQGAVRGERAARQAVRRRRRRHPGRAVAAVRPAHRSRPIRDLPGATSDQSVAVHVLPGPGRIPDSGGVAGDAGAGRGRKHRHAPHSRHASAGGNGGRRTRSWSTACAPTRRSAPNTSCCWTCRATTWAV